MTTNNLADDAILTVSQAAELLGKQKRFFDVNRKGATADVIPFIRVDSRTVLYRKSALMTWLLERETTTHKCRAYNIDAKLPRSKGRPRRVPAEAAA
jgi:hypothetical protein